MQSYVLITGATGGLGKAFASECASRGWDLFLTDLSEGALRALKTGLERMYGVKVHYYVCDLMEPDERRVLWQHIADLKLSFHSLINVAGLDYEGWFSDRQIDELQTIVRVNIEATVEMTRRILQFRSPAEILRIINVSSMAAFYPMPVKAVYAASKRFLLDWSLALREELRPAGVTITVLCPAGMRTNNACIQGIDAQGFMGQMTTLDVGYIAYRTIGYALSGRGIYIPGIVNKAMRFLSASLPSPIIAFLIGRRWEKCRRKISASSILPAPFASRDRLPG